MFPRKCSLLYICETEMLFSVWMRYGLAKIHIEYFFSPECVCTFCFGHKYRNDKNFRNTGEKGKEVAKGRVRGRRDERVLIPV